MTDNDFTPTTSGVVWSLTPRLRWLLKTVRSTDGRYTTITVLQQMWQGSDGTQEWRDVPEVNDP